MPSNSTVAPLTNNDDKSDVKESDVESDIELVSEQDLLRRKRFKSVLSESRLSRTHSENDKESRHSKSKSGLNRSFSRDSPCGRIYSKNRNTLRIYDSVPKNAMPPLHIINQDEVKRKFFESNIPPVLQFKASQKVIQGILVRYSKPNYKYFFKAKNILDIVKKKYGTDSNKFFEANFGKRVTSKDCIDLVGKYLIDNKIGGEITINFAPGLTCSGRITSYNWRKDRPEARKFVIWINDGEENQFLREDGIVCLCDHEIGTHYYRSYNEGLQIWFSERKKFKLRSLTSTELLKIEEGIAALHTLMNARVKLLYLPAMLYYLVCMAHKMNFQQLFQHMETYIASPEERWKHVTRVKRGISDPFEVGCYSRDQAYFEGAIEILEKIDEIDFKVLMCGKLCVDELERIKRVSRTECIKMPKFSADMKAYKQKLRQIGIINGILEPNQENDKKRKANNNEVEKFIDQEIKNGIAAKNIQSPRNATIHVISSTKPNSTQVQTQNGASTSVCILL